MLDHPIIDVALGLIFFYVLLSLIASAIQEWIAGVLKLRAKTLRAGIDNLIDDAALVRNVMTHPLIKGLSKKKKNQAAEDAEDVTPPSYISSATLSAVLMKQLDPRGTLETAEDNHALRKAIGEVGGKLEALAGPLLEANDKNANDVRRRLAVWFDEGMSRVGGWYKRKAELWIFGIAAVLTVTVNADSIAVAKALWRHDALRACVVAQATQVATSIDVNGLNSGRGSGRGMKVTREEDDGSPSGNGDSNSETEATAESVCGEPQTLASFPIGWQATSGADTQPAADEFWAWIVRAFGWLLTIAAVSLGAPFWFDLLGRVANLRSAGRQVKTKETEE